MIWSVEFLEEGGYRKPLGNKSGINLTSLMKFNFRGLLELKKSKYFYWVVDKCGCLLHLQMVRR